MKTYQIFLANGVITTITTSTLREALAEIHDAGLGPVLKVVQMA